MLIKLSKLNNTYINSNHIIKVQADSKGQVSITLVDGSKVFTEEYTLESILIILNK